MPITALVEPRRFQPGDEAKGDGVNEQNEAREVHPLNWNQREKADRELHEEDGNRLRRVLPSQPLCVDQNHEHAEAECVVHAARTLQCRQRDGDAVSGLLQSVVVRRDQLGRVGRQRCENEGHVERRNVDALSELREHVHHRVGEEKDERRPESHHVERAHEDPPLLLLRGQVHEVLGHFLWLFLVRGFFGPGLGYCFASRRVVHELRHALNELLQVDVPIAVGIILVEAVVDFVEIEGYAKVAQYEGELPAIDLAVATLVVEDEERLQDLLQARIVSGPVQRSRLGNRAILDEAAHHSKQTDLSLLDLFHDHSVHLQKQTGVLIRRLRYMILVHKVQDERQNADDHRGERPLLLSGSNLIRRSVEIRRRDLDEQIAKRCDHHDLRADANVFVGLHAHLEERRLHPVDLGNLVHAVAIAVDVDAPSVHGEEPRDRQKHRGAARQGAHSDSKLLLGVGAHAAKKHNCPIGHGSKHW
mmetsp:Transcript_2366/g.10083  ORF Transcript_2366/g.10083 Transcript_2366/m.10083 type:complete len:475 (+) Transcript_2366:243-1667(+)